MLPLMRCFTAGHGETGMVPFSDDIIKEDWWGGREVKPTDTK